MNPPASIDFQTQTTTCGALDATLGIDGILESSATCTSVRDAYRDDCCHGECRICQVTTTSGGSGGDDLLDLRSEHVVRQGGYEASCQEIDDILGGSSSAETICVDAKAQLADQCCYRQCSLCSTGTMRTEWYETVAYEGLTTTCLGIDYVLRAQQVSDGSSRCSELRGEYASQCCRASGTACVLCSSDDELYQIYSDKLVTEPSSTRQTTTTTCAAANDMLARLEKSDQKCTDGKQALFGQCCDLGSSIVLDDGIDLTTSPGGGGGSAALDNVPGVALGPISNPSPGGIVVAPDAASGQGSVPQPPSSAPTPGTSGLGAIPNSPGSRSPGEVVLQPQTSSPTATFIWGVHPSNMSWVGIWEGQQHSCGFHAAALRASIVVCILSIHLFLA